MRLGLVLRYLLFSALLKPCVCWVVSLPASTSPSSSRGNSHRTRLIDGRSLRWRGGVAERCFPASSTRQCSSSSSSSSSSATTEQAETALCGVDVILSSGFCAFASHCGFLQGLEQTWAREEEARVRGIVGTSSGALVGSLWAAGYPAEKIYELVSATTPIRLVGRPHLMPWKGLMSLQGVVEMLEGLLPPLFEDLTIPFAVGVVDSDGHHKLLHSGSLPEAVAASMAVPRTFKPVDVSGAPYSDGGSIDRTALEAWRKWRPDRRAIVHLVDTSSKSKAPNRDGVSDWRSDPNVLVMHSKKSSASLFSLGDFEQEFVEAVYDTVAILDPEQFAGFPDYPNPWD